MIKTILVPQDGSVYGKSALDYSMWLSSRFGAGLVGINVVDVVSLEGPFLHDISGSLGFEPFLNFSTRMREALEARGKTILSAFEDACKENGTACESQITFGVVANEIIDKAKVADLVVIGRRGVNARFEYGLLGSTTESVLRRSPKPVLIVPERFTEPKKPLLAYDGSPNASRAMHSAAEWAKTLDLSLTVLTVSSSEEEDPILNDARTYLKPYGIQASFVHRKGDPPIVIENYYKDNGHDLLFMGTSHHSRLVEMVLGSTTEHVMRTVPGPFFLER
ncbi:MAG: universal stress protein [Candidatus Methylomirabilis sp.]|nr:universal stress protein [Deltaproteobacteria bacterium]